jgi:hypothetical protein
MKLNIGQQLKICGKERRVEEVIPVTDDEELYRFGDEWGEELVPSATESELDALAADGQIG